jgi:TM2 domain-containing membrane protein YozV
MHGRVLDFDFRSGEGLITGDDGNRYRFVATEWKPNSQPAIGSKVDFETSDGQALAIYAAALAPTSGTYTASKNKVTAALLAFFLGGLGIHKFYLGKSGAGMVMLLSTLFSWILLFIPLFIIATIAFIEFIIYLTLSDEEFERRYVQGNQSWF